MFREMLEQTRAAFGPTPRRFKRDEVPFIKATPPPFMQMDRQDKLWQQFNDQNAIFTHGRVVWGHLIQANQILFQEGPDDAPAAWLYSLDPYYDEAVDELADIAHGLFDVKGEQTGDPEVQRFADMLYDERERQLRLPIPRSMTGGREVIYTCGTIIRAHLPVPFLATSLFPLVVAPEKSEATWIVPSRWWGEDTLTVWFNSLDG